MLDPLRIEVFPNSGHLVLFFPLLAEDPSNENEIHRRIGIANQVTRLNDAVKKWLRLRASDWDAIHRSAIRNSPKWIRAWIGVQDRLLTSNDEQKSSLTARLIGVWVAIESNVGDRSRGYTTRTSMPTVATEVAVYNEERALETPYACRQTIDTGRIPSKFTIELGTDPPTALCELNITWLEPDGEHPIEVDLIVDFGNTRTAVLALEHRPNAFSFAPICRPIPFLSNDAASVGRDHFAFNESEVLIDSWFMLREPRFEFARLSNTEVPNWNFALRNIGGGRTERYIDKVTYRIPHMFVELSPAAMGQVAKTDLLKLDLSLGGNFFMSSPKRYAWDTDVMDGGGDPDWHMVPLDPKRLREGIAGIPKLQGQLLRFMIADGSHWTFADPPTHRQQNNRPVPNPIHPQYPRSDALTWTALSLLENAYRTINSAAWRRSHRPRGARKLREVVVTYPSGWTANEINAYRLHWQRAIDIFLWTRIERAKPDDIRLSMNLDEAVASQLPIVVSEISRLNDDGTRWIEAVGRGNGKDAQVRIMSIDIGGGTTDTSVIEFRDSFPGEGTDLEAKILFKDSTTIAGDLLRKKILENVLIPKMIVDRAGLDQAKARAFFLGPQTPVGYAKWARYTRVLFLPLVNRLLGDLVSNTTASFTIADIFQTNEDSQILDEFNREAQDRLGVPLLERQSLHSLSRYSGSMINCIRKCFEPAIRGLAKHVAAFDCDLVIVTGKPSELPSLHSMVERWLPIAPSRLLFAKDYFAGQDNWPLSQDGRIQDAKFVTVVGAALAQAIQASLRSRWTLKMEHHPRMLTKNWWGVPRMNGVGFAQEILNTDQELNEVEIQLGATIARQILPGNTAPEPIYVVRWRDRNLRNGPRTTLKIVFQRHSPKFSGAGESLSIQSAHGTLQVPGALGEKQVRQITEKDIELKLCTLHQGEKYWLDSGRFQVGVEEGQ